MVTTGLVVAILAIVFYGCIIVVALYLKGDVTASISIFRRLLEFTLTAKDPVAPPSSHRVLPPSDVPPPIP